MSVINKMKITGIRSFGPEDDDAQMITFFAPLTLILGPNGTGKTTIIECLKYITTGDLPPGATKNAAFVNDPKIAGSREVKAQVKLLFKDLNSMSCTITRSLSATQKAKLISMKTMDCLLERRGKDGETTTVNSRCAELDREMVAALGVSKAVLDNVIFCHQEESNWPLGEGKSVKSKFDDIFASTRYVKALDEIKKVKKSQDAEIKLFKQVIPHLKNNRDTAISHERKLAEFQARFAAQAQSLKDLRDKVKPIDDKIIDIGTKQGDIFRVQTQVEKYSTKREELKKSMKEIEEGIKEKFNGSNEELQDKLSEFKNELKKREKSMRDIEEKIRNLTRDAEKKNREKSNLLVEQGRLQQEAANHQVNLGKRRDLVQKYATEFNFAGFNEVDDDAVRKFLQKIKDKSDNYMTEAQKLREQYDIKEAVLQEKIDETRDIKANFEQSEKMKTQEIQKNKIEIRKISQELVRVQSVATKLDQIREDLEQAERKLKDSEKEIDIESFESDVRRLNRERSDLDREVKQLDVELRHLHEESSVRTQLEMLKKDKSTKVDQSKRIKNRHEETLVHLFANVPDSKLGSTVESHIRNLEREIKRDSEKKQKFQSQHSGVEMQLKLNRNEIRKKEDELNNSRRSIEEVFGNDNFEQGLNEMQNKISSVQDEKGSLVGAQYFYRKYQRQLEKDDPVCPLCVRGFDEASEVDDLVRDIEGKLNMIPHELEKKDRDIVELTEKFHKMLELKPVQTQVTELAEETLPKLKTDQQNYIKKIEELKNQIDSLDETITTREVDNKTANNIKPDMMNWDRLQSEIKDLDRKIAQQAAQLSGDSTRTVEEVTKEKDSAQQMLDVTSKELDDKRDKVSKQKDLIQKLRGHVNDLNGEKLQIENDLQNRIKFEEKKDELAKTNARYEKDIRDEQDQIKPLEEKMEQMRSEREALMEEKDTKIDDVKNKISKLKEYSNNVQHMDRDVQRYQQSNKERELQKIEGKMEDLTDQIDNIETDKAESNMAMNQIREDIANQQVKERELNDNLLLRKKEDEVAEMEERISHLKVKIEGFDLNNLERQKKKLEEEKENKMKDIHSIEGRQRGVQEQIQEKKAELKKEEYIGADQKYREKMIALKTTETACHDLDKYYVALDKAIMSYHQTKMTEINKIIKELWRNTYRGNDIETIEIKSDEDDSTSSTKRRVYNYRVVMVKNGIELDMRGRCSAGQKVLASLIIRLALAESFCINCGVLALDEPTTNLDRENIESLACALVEIIKSRAKQRNFQLVVITHDEDFVELLGSSEHVDEFFRISRSVQGKSLIKRDVIRNLRR